MIPQVSSSENQIRSFTTAISATEDEIQHLFDFNDVFASCCLSIDIDYLISIIALENITHYVLISIVFCVNIKRDLI